MASTNGDRWSIVIGESNNTGEDSRPRQESLALAFREVSQSSSTDTHLAIDGSSCFDYSEGEWTSLLPSLQRVCILVLLESNVRQRKSNAIVSFARTSNEQTEFALMIKSR